jgi:hypothetical protein
MGGGSCKDSTEQQWAYSSFIIGPTQSGMTLRSIQMPGLSCLQLLEYNTYQHPFILNSATQKETSTIVQ